MISFNDFKSEYNFIQDEINVAINRVLKSGFYILSNEVQEFENEVADYLGVKYCIGTGNGFDSLQVILMSLGIKEGDEVITTPNSAFATTLAILKVGANPVFVDIMDESYQLNYALVEESITEKTKAVLPVHIYGNMNSIYELEKLCKKHNLFLIEDACQSFGAKLENRFSGTIGIAGAFSFYPTKNLSCYGDGGLIATNNKEINEKARMLINYGQSKRYYHDIIGINSRLDSVQAAILRVKLKHIEFFNQKRIAIAQAYEEEISNLLIKKPQFLNNGSHIFHLYVLRSKYRDRIIEFLKDKHISSLIHYPVPIHKQKAIRSGLENKVLGNSESFANEFFSIPIHPFLNDNDIKTIILALNNFKLN